MKNILKKLTACVPVVFAMAVLAFTPTANAVTSNLIVTEAMRQGWAFNPDLSNATAYEFSEAEHSIGAGSLYVEPINTVAAHKFIAAKTLNIPTQSFNSVSYDFLIKGDGRTALDANQFYLNVYTKLAGFTGFYSCRFDFVPNAGSTTAFTTATFSSADPATHVEDRTVGNSCPATLSGMPDDSTISFIALNVGDTSTSDVGLAGYLDKVVFMINGDQTTYDFELNFKLDNKEACKKDGWMTSDDPEFKNQGDCVSYFASKTR
jgi:hypothetical protein